PALAAAKTLAQPGSGAVGCALAAHSLHANPFTFWCVHSLQCSARARAEQQPRRLRSPFIDPQEVTAANQSGSNKVVSAFPVAPETRTSPFYPNCPIPGSVLRGVAQTSTASRYLDDRGRCGEHRPFEHPTP